MKNWKSLLIAPSTSMEEAIKILDKGAQRISLVVDEHCHLLGTITDGDIRRALINHLPMHTPVSKMMCAKPYKADSSWNKKLVQATLEKYQLLHLPLVDNQGRVIGLYTLHELLKTQRYDNPIFLMAGGFGLRLYPLTKNCPKPLLKIGDKPILEIILDRFIAAGFHRFFISTHYKHDMIEQYFADGMRFGINITYLYEQKPLGTAGALGLFPAEELDLPLFVMNGDLLTHVNFESLLAFHQAHPAIASMCVRQYEHAIPYGVIEGQNHCVLSMVEKPIKKFFINAGIYIVQPELVKQVPRDIPIDMPTLLQQQIDTGHKVNMFPIHEYWLDIGRMEDFQLAQNEYLTI